MTNKILLLAARDITGKRTGRITVLETAVSALTKKGYEVHVIPIAKVRKQEWMGISVNAIKPPSLALLPFRLVANAVNFPSINGTVFNSKKINKTVAKYCIDENIDVIIADTLRVWKAAAHTNLPVIMHLDDLLSDRYKYQVTKGEINNILGYLETSMPKALVTIANVAAKLILSYEYRAVGCEEKKVSQQAKVIALTSREEAEAFSKNVGREVIDLPMGVKCKKKITPSSNEGIVFLGGLDYYPNLEALLHFQKNIIPILEKNGFFVKVTVIGHSTPEHRSQLDNKVFIFKGYVEDLAAELSKFRLFISPIVSGKGVKTKVLDALSVGLPVVSTPLGVAGISLNKGLDYLHSDNSQQFAENIQRLLIDDELLESISESGYNFLQKNMSVEKIENKWLEAVRKAMDSNEK